MIRRLLLLIAFTIIHQCSLNAQPLSAGAEIYLITCGPGEDLYATFGHSAIRISDRSMGIDKVYNYGTFDFDTPNFYVKFARGKLNYILNVTGFDAFLRTYQYEGRWVVMQKILLTESEKKELYAFLEWNALPENRAYQYDFFYDNCSTRIRDVLEKLLSKQLQYPENPSDTTRTFRNLIDLYLESHPWSDLGIDLALGLPCDKPANWREKMFLPDYLMRHLSQATIVRLGVSEPLLDEPIPVLDGIVAAKTEPRSVIWIFWVLFAISSFTGLFVKAEKMRYFDIAFFGIIGMVGIVVALLWFATDHSATKWNLNLLWASPTWLYGMVVLIRKKSASNFFKAHAILLFAIIVFWVLIPQNFHAAVIPIILSLIARSWSWQKRKFALK